MSLCRSILSVHCWLAPARTCTHPSLQYRIVYSTKLEGYTLAAVRAAVAPMVASNGFQYTMYCALFITGRPVPTAGRVSRDL